VLVIDHNEQLFNEMKSRLAQINEVRLMQNEGHQGLSAARNTGVRYARGDVIVFVDDDAWAEPNFLEQMLLPYEDRSTFGSHVYGVGGRIDAVWTSVRPEWFPPEFDWVVGCSYLQSRNTARPVRNFIGAAMSFRREVFDQLGGFDENAGRIASKPLGCEETELCIRLKRYDPSAQLIQFDMAKVNHEVTEQRSNLKYFVRRCWSEGISKAFVATRVGANYALSEEKGYVSVVLPSAILREIRRFFHGEIGSIKRSLMMMVGVVVTGLGYARGRFMHLLMYFA